MIRSRFSLLGVLVAAIGLMAAFASAAQAEGEWLVLKAGGAGLYSGAEIEANKEKFEGTIESPGGTLLSELLGQKIAIVCTAGEIVDALLNATGGIKEGADIKFTGCKFFSGGATGLEKEQAKCVPKTGGGALGTVLTRPGHALLRLHELKATGEKHDTLLILPDNVEKEFVNLELGASCGFGENVPVFGEFSVWSCNKEPNKEWLEHLLTHLITEFKPLTKLTILEPEPNGTPATIDGSANVKLASDRLYAGSPK